MCQNKFSLPIFNNFACNFNKCLFKICSELVRLTQGARSALKRTMIEKSETAQTFTTVKNVVRVSKRF